MALEVKVPARGALEVRPVAGRRELSTFIKLPWRIYRNEPRWVPPLLFDRKRFLDRSRNPFFKHAEADIFRQWLMERLQESDRTGETEPANVARRGEHSGGSANRR